MKICTLAFLFISFIANARPVDVDCDCTPTKSPYLAVVEKAGELLGNSDLVHATIQESIKAHIDIQKPVKYVETGDPNVPKFPSYSKCKKSFFRVATVPNKIDQIINVDGWKSGWVRREDELKSKGLPVTDIAQFDALPPSAPIEERIIQYVRIKNKKMEFPKNSTIVGVLENPIRTLSVGYHTGYDSGIQGNPMRMDEIEVGPCAQAPECQKLVPVDTSLVFAKRGLAPRYSTEGEYAIDRHVPRTCVVATYRIKFGKVDKACYSDANGNCNF